MQRLKKVVFAVLGFSAFLFTGWVFYHQVTTAMSTDKYPAPGQLVDVGGRKIHVVCRGEGSGPAAVLVSGLGAIPYYAWPDVAEPLAREGKTCLYDRAGYGWSDPHEGDLNLDIVLQDLDHVVQYAGGGHPVVLVGHSYGGLLVRQYALKHPASVAGLVLLDSSHEQSISRYPKDDDFPTGKPDWIAGFMPAIGYYRFYADFMATKEGVDYLSDHDFDQLMELYTHTDYHLAINTERRDVLGVTFPALKAGALGDMPVEVLSRDPALGVETPLHALQEKAWTEMQQELAQVSTNSNHVVLEGASHNFTLERPDAIIAAVRRVIAQH